MQKGFQEPPRVFLETWTPASQTRLHGCSSQLDISNPRAQAVVSVGSSSGPRGTGVAGSTQGLAWLGPPPLLHREISLADI